MTTARRRDRPLEWFLAGFSLTTSSASLLDRTTEALAADHRLAAAAASLGIAHMAALLVNGTAAWTPLARLIVTTLNAGLFAWIASAAATTGGLVLPAIIYGYVTIGFVWCGCVAGHDAARMKLGTYGLD
jgi:hypothetical protein